MYKKGGKLKKHEIWSINAQTTEAAEELNSLGVTQENRGEL
jgi:hypothetical protein